MTDRSFNKDCPVCLDPLFDRRTGVANKEVADLICHHVVHSDCVVQMAEALNADGRRYGEGGFGPRVGCPTCEEGTSCWHTSKQMGFFPAYWVDKIEKALLSIHPPEGMRHRPVPVRRIGAMVLQDPTVPKRQKRYLKTERGLQQFKKALEFAGNVRYGGKRIWSGRLYSRGIFKWNKKKNTLWLWAWGDVVPGSECSRCHAKQATMACPGRRIGRCAPVYCGTECQQAHLPSHRGDCDEFQSESSR